MRILVTGATGFLGSHITEDLVRRGHRVRVGVRATSDLRWIDGLDAERVVADLGNPDDLERLVANVDAVVHGAGITRARRQEEFLAVNADATGSLARAARRAGCARFVLLSSLAARGPDQAHAPGDAPVSWYGLSKLRAERRLREEQRAGDMTGVALRIGGVYGPRDTDLLSLFQAASYGILPLPPRGLRAQPIHVGDVVSAVDAALETGVAFGPWPVSHPDTYGWDELGACVAEALGRRVVRLHVPAAVFMTAARISEARASRRGVAPTLDLRRAEDLSQFSYTTDVTPTMDHLGWTPAVPASEGLASTARWYREQRWIP